MDDIDREIERGKIGKREEPLINRPKSRETPMTEKKYYLPPQDVNYHKYKKLEKRLRDSPRYFDQFVEAYKAKKSLKETRLFFLVIFIFIVLLISVITKWIGLW